MNLKTDICIVGAGPGGCATALKLSYAGQSCMLIDKADFPRDKVCGDAVSGKVTTLIGRLDRAIWERFEAMGDKYVSIWGIRFAAPNGRELDIPFKKLAENNLPPGLVCKRVDFDNFLIKEVKRRKDIDLYTSVEVAHFEKVENGYVLYDKKKNVLVECRLLIVANGAYSSFSRKNAYLKKENNHYAAAVKAYYKGVKGGDVSDFIELHFVDGILPGYFWIFPLPDNTYNVGLGMRSDFVKRDRINLRQKMEAIIASHPKFKERFAGADRVSDIEGYGLPLGSKRRNLSGDSFMLVGDAGHLIDPLTGEGIGNAFYSGFIAADQALKCLEAERFDAAFMLDYDVRVGRVLYSEMRLSYQLQRMLVYPWLANMVAWIIKRNKSLLFLLSDMYTDLSLRKKLINPMFWVKNIFQKGKEKKPVTIEANIKDI